MERILQLLDDVDDLVGSIGLAGERLRAIAVLLGVTLLTCAMLAAAILLAMNHPPLALGTAVLLFTVLFYHIVTSPRGMPARR